MLYSLYQAEPSYYLSHTRKYSYSAVKLPERINSNPVRHMVMLIHVRHRSSGLLSGHCATFG
jgi:hypothetical protein